MGPVAPENEPAGAAGALTSVRPAPGTLYRSRKDLQTANLHRAGQSGIVGTHKTGAESIVLSGGYEDDEDLGDVIVYTGQGGRDSRGAQVSDQSFAITQNGSLITSCLTGSLVRVIRGPNRNSLYAPETGYRYDGDYRVESYWQERGKSGYLVCRYRLLAAEGNPSVPMVTTAPVFEPVEPSPPLGNPEPSYRSTTTQRIVRSSKIAERVKLLHGNQCQVCGIRLQIGDRHYSEGAHIRPLGRPHAGRDTLDNILCLCANCHVLFDNGALIIQDDLTILQNGCSAGVLRRHPKHPLDMKAIEYHRSLFPELLP